MITRHQKIKKLLIIIMGQLPALMITLFQIWNNFDSNGEVFKVLPAWSGLLVALSVNVLVFSWPYIVYYVMLSKMGYITTREKVLRDPEGREWICY
jgi:hypothetical protein